jgi:hypothetical protein
VREVPLGDDGRLRPILDYLGRELEPSNLIGGWATFARVGGEFSRDIDFIIGSEATRDKVRAIVGDLPESGAPQGVKWRGEGNGVHVDIYLPYQSQLGNLLRLRVEVLAEYAERLDGSGWQLLTIEAHTISKLAALLDRPDTEKGEKDAGELLRLLRLGVDPRKACMILATATAAPLDVLPGYVERGFRLIAERSRANKADRRMLDRLRREWLDAIAEVIDTAERGRPGLR